MNKLLLIEDDENIRSPLLKVLTTEGFQVTAAENLAQANAAIARESFHLILLDWNLPDGEGLDWLVSERKKGLSQPVIMLTARTDLVDKVIGLEFGANDYVTKPFEARELIARVRVHLRIQNQAPAHILTYGQLKIDIIKHTAEFESKPLHLTPNEFELLKFMVERLGKLVTRQELAEAIWKSAAEADGRALDNCVLQLRKKLPSDFIQTVRAVGYKLRVHQ